MYGSFEEKGKIFTQIISKTPVEVYIQLENYHIRGNIHTRPEDRIKDEVNLPERFLAVTDATIFSAQGEALQRTNFIAVNREHILWVVPVSDIVSTDESK
ncbi:MAG: hypothetical protein GYA17_12605 [Chloroflexi bacterium]|jgi:hypothetical protein|nr:hypothetical protein [Anaerolineaceae bacterium]NMB89192.1 hypothetical protein [Chloroflexota bacterium]